MVSQPSKMHFSISAEQKLLKFFLAGSLRSAQFNKTIKTFAYIILLDLLCVCVLCCACATWIKCKRNDREKKKQKQNEFVWEEKKPVSIEERKKYVFCHLLLAYIRRDTESQAHNNTYVLHLRYLEWHDRSKDKNHCFSLLNYMYKEWTTVKKCRCNRVAEHTLDIASIRYLCQWFFNGIENKWLWSELQTSESKNLTRIVS